jgi:hypothetical protein
MPLVVPGITNTGSGNSKDDWLNKLVGKKISDSHNETVLFSLIVFVLTHVPLILIVFADSVSQNKTSLSLIGS